jgi:ATP-dependent DNA ligase
VNDEDELMLAFEKFRSQGFEGAMVRNADGAYVGKRSVDLQKVKEFDDAEFKVVGVTEGRGKLAGHAIFVCRTDRGTEFEAKMKGDQSRLKKLWDNPELCVGRRVTVQYQGLTTKNKVPRFPVAVRLAEGL